MVRLLVVAALLIEVGLSFSSVAQTPNGATDNELYAAYCTGVLDEWIDEITSSIRERPSLEKIERQLKQHNPAGLSPEEIHGVAQDILARDEKTWETTQILQADLNNERRRFAKYLLATGVLTDLKRSTAVLGVTVATGQGREDVKQCMVGLPGCFNLPQLNEEDSAKTQLKECYDHTACPKVPRCRRPDSLPF